MTGMTGLKMTTMTVKEMRAARERSESKTDLENFCWVSRCSTQPTGYPEIIVESEKQISGVVRRLGRTQ